MKAEDDFFYLGKITKLHAFGGKLVIFLDTDEPAKYENLKSVFVNGKDGLIPYFFSEFKRNNNRAIVKFQDVNTSEQASEMVGKELYLPLKELSPLTGNKFYYHEILGFEVIDKYFGIIGTVKDVLEYPNQAVIQVFYKKKEVLIPINDEIIILLDRDNKTIHVNLPEGLLYIYIR